MKSPNERETVIYFIDGTNLCYWLDTTAPTLQVLLELVAALKKEKNRSFYCIFDANTQYKLPQEEREIYQHLLDFKEYFYQVTGGKRADDFILELANSYDAPVISNDNYSDPKYAKYTWKERDFQPKRLFMGEVIPVRNDTHLIMSELDLHVMISESVQNSYRKAMRAISGNVAKYKGRVKFYNQQEGWGLLVYDQDIYFQRTALLENIDEGSEVEFAIVGNEKGTFADQIILYSSRKEKQNFQTGTIEMYDEQKTMGTIKADTGEILFFYKSYFEGNYNAVLSKGLRVEFVMGTNKNGPCARHINIIPIDETKPLKDKIVLLESQIQEKDRNITEWKQRYSSMEGRLRSSESKLANLEKNVKEQQQKQQQQPKTEIPQLLPIAANNTNNPTNENGKAIANGQSKNNKDKDNKKNNGHNNKNNENNQQQQQNVKTNNSNEGNLQIQREESIVAEVVVPIAEKIVAPQAEKPKNDNKQQQQQPSKKQATKEKQAASNKNSKEQQAKNSKANEAKNEKNSPAAIKTTAETPVVEEKDSNTNTVHKEPELSITEKAPNDNSSNNNQENTVHSNPTTATPEKDSNSSNKREGKKKSTASKNETSGKPKEHTATAKEEKNNSTNSIPPPTKEKVAEKKSNSVDKQQPSIKTEVQTATDLFVDKEQKSSETITNEAITSKTLAVNNNEYPTNVAPNPPAKTTNNSLNAEAFDTSIKRRQWWLSLQPQWKKAFNFTLGRGEITDVPDDDGLIKLFSLNKLNYSKAAKNKLTFALTNLSGIQFLTNLQQLTVSEQAIIDLKGLEKLHKLTILNLNKNNLITLDGIENLGSIEELHCSGNQLTLANLTTLKQYLPKLRLLDCRLNKLEDTDKKQLKETKIAELKV